MNPETPFILTLILAFFFFIYMMVRSKHKHELAKLDRIAAGNADWSLTAGELEDMIKGIVSDVTAPMQEQLDHLSRRLDSSSEPGMPRPGEREDEATVEDKSIGRRTRA